MAEVHESSVSPRNSLRYESSVGVVNAPSKHVKVHEIPRLWNSIVEDHESGVSRRDFLLYKLIGLLSRRTLLTKRPTVLNATPFV